MQKVISWIIIAFVAIILLEIVAKLVILLLPVIVLGVSLWYFQEPIGGFIEKIKNEWHKPV